MDNNTQVAVDIMIRTSTGSAAGDFNKALARMEADARAFAANITKIMNGAFGARDWGANGRAAAQAYYKGWASVKPPGGFGGGGGSGGATSARNNGTVFNSGKVSLWMPGADVQLYNALRDAQRYQQQRSRMEAEYTDHVKKQAEAQFRYRAAQDKRATQEFIREINQRKQAEANSNQRTGLGFTAASFVGNLGANLATSAIQQGIAYAKEGAQAWLTYASNIEQARIGMKNMTGSIIVANGHIKDLQDFAKTTPFEFGELVIASQKLQGVGVEARNVIPILKDVGNALAASGRISELPFAIKALGDIQAKGKLAGQEIIQLANAGIPAIKALSEFLKMTSAQVLKLSEDGQISSEVMFAALRKFSEVKFGNAMVEQSKTFNGAMSNIKDTLYQTSETAFNPLYQRISKLAVAFADEIGRKQGDYKYVGKIIGKYIGEGLATSIEFVVPATVDLFMDQMVKLFTDPAENLGQRITGGIIRGMARAWQKIDEAQPWWLKLMTGAGARELIWDSTAGKALTTVKPETNTATGNYTRTMPGTSGFNLNLRSPTAANVLGGTRIFSNPFGTPANNTAPVSFIDLPGEKEKKAKVKKPDWALSSRGQALVTAAERLGVSPLDLATLIDYETIGTYSPTIMGGKGGKYKGLIQFGPSEQAKYNVGRNNTFESQLLNSVVPFLQDRFRAGGRSTQGATLLDLYTTVNGGNPNVSSGASDGNGTIAQHVRRMSGVNRNRALNTFFGGSTGNVRDTAGAIDLSTLSDQATKAQQDEMTRAAIKAWQISGLIPTGSMLRDFRQLAVDEARRTGEAQPSELDIQNLFAVNAVNRLSGRGVIANTGSTVQSGGLVARLNMNEQYVKGLKESFNWNERNEALILRQVNSEAEISLYVQDQIVARKEAYAQNVIDLGVMERRNVLAETELAYVQSITTEKGKEKDIEGALALLRMQNADPGFVGLRRRNMAGQENYDLSSRATELKDLIANGGINDSLRIEVALLEQVNALRDRELNAIIAAGSAQLEIQQQVAYSATEANARVLQFMASQKGVTEIVADFRIGLLETGYDYIDKGLDKIIPKMGMLSNVIKDLLGSFIKLALNSAFRRLFGLESGASGGSGGGGNGGGIGGFFGSLLGGGANSSSGGGGSVSQGAASGFNLGALTPGFNPSASNRLGGILSGGVSGAPDIGNILTGTGGNVISATTGATGAAAKTGKLAAIGNFLNSPAFAGGLAGLGIGAQIGGGRGVGGILGGVGGALLGGAGAVIGGGIITGGVAGLGAALAATPFALLGAGILLVSWLIGRSARAKREKAQVNTLSGDALNRIKELVKNVQMFKIDGASAYDQGVQIRDSFAEQITQLKDKGAKKLAQTKLTEINSMLATLKTEGDRSTMMKNVARVTDESIVPTFAVGGFTGFSHGARNAILHSQEVVLNQSNIMALGGYRAMQRAGVRGISMSGAPDRYEKSYNGHAGRGGNSGGDQPIYVIAAYGDQQADELFEMVSDYGVAKKVRVASKKDLAGMNDMLAQKMAGK